MRAPWGAGLSLDFGESTVQQMQIYGVSFDMVGKQPIVLLKTVDGNRFLPIWIGHPEAAAILMKLQGASTPRPMTHDLLSDLLEQIEAKCERVSVTELRDNTFYASITISVNGSEMEIDSRPSDAIALAVRTQAPIFAAEDVIEESSIEFEHEVEDTGGGRREVQGLPRRGLARGLRRGRGVAARPARAGRSLRPDCQHRERRARALAQPRDALRLEPRARSGRRARPAALGSKSGCGVELAELVEEVLEAARRDDLEDPAGLVAGVPERVPLVARLEHEVADLGVDDLVAEQRAHPPLEHEAVLVLARVLVERARPGAAAASGARPARSPPPVSSVQAIIRAPIEPRSTSLPSLGPTIRGPCEASNRFSVGLSWSPSISRLLIR